MRIVFVRHGKDDDKYRGGWSSLDLIPEGIEQAKKLVKHLAENRMEYNITRIISSDLPRTMTTASYISAELGLPVLEEPQIRETNNGDLAGMLNDEALVRYPGGGRNTDSAIAHLLQTIHHAFGCIHIIRRNGLGLNRL